MKDTTIYSSVYVGLSNQKFGSAARLKNITKDDAIKKARQIMKAYDWTEATVEAYIYAENGGGLIDIKKLATIKN
jgi:hypothetical protein